MESERELLDTLKDWKMLRKNLMRLKDRIDELEFRITPTLSHDKVFVNGSAASKIETYCFSRMKIIDERDAILKKMKACIRAYNDADLTEDEQLAIRYTCSGKSLLELSRKKNMAQARIYRIRARAIKKMFIEIQNASKMR